MGQYTVQTAPWQKQCWLVHEGAACCGSDHNPFALRIERKSFAGTTLQLAWTADANRHFCAKASCIQTPHGVSSTTLNCVWLMGAALLSGLHNLPGCVPVGLDCVVLCLVAWSSGRCALASSVSSRSSPSLAKSCNANPLAGRGILFLCIRYSWRYRQRCAELAVCDRPVILPGAHGECQAGSSS